MNPEHSKKGLDLLPEIIRENYEVHEWRHACAILKNDFPEEWEDIITVLQSFQLKRDDILKPGGRKSNIAVALDQHFYKLGWVEKQFKTEVIIDDIRHKTPTHKIDCVKSKVAVEIEWNNKDPFFDRDLNNFRLLHELGAISVGVIITRCGELQNIFTLLGKGSSYGSSTTIMEKLIPRIEGKGAGGCPLLVFGITSKLYKE